MAPMTSGRAGAQFNLAHAWARERGTGSAFKPIVLATALAQEVPLSEVLRGATLAVPAAP